MVNDQRLTNLVQNVTRFWLVEIHVIPALWCRFVYPLASISHSLPLSRKRLHVKVSFDLFTLRYPLDGAALSIRSLRERGKLLFFPRQFTQLPPVKRSSQIFITCTNYQTTKLKFADKQAPKFVIFWCLLIFLPNEFKVHYRNQFLESR